MDISVKTPNSSTEKPVSPEWQKSQLETIAESLPEGPNAAVHFFAEDQFKSSDISLKVEGVGCLNFHGQSSCLHKLMQASSAAGGKIPAQSVLVLLDQGELSRVLDGIRVRLGLEGDMEAQQGAMLVREGGRCDCPPQDGDDVVGTLVIVLPFPHRGGDLVLQRGTERHAFISEDAGPDVFKCVGFLADSTSAVGQVSEGCFVALTYKLLLKSKPHTGLYVNSHLICAVADYFDGFQPGDFIENKFVCMLKEYYAERSLKWHMLRGDDHVTGSALLAVAEALRLVPYLALVEIRHSHSRHFAPFLHHAQCDVDRIQFLKFVDSSNEQQADAKQIQVKIKEICWKGSTASWNLANCKGPCVRYGAAVVMWSSSMSSELKWALHSSEFLEKLRATMKCAGKEKEVVEIVKKFSKYFHSENKRHDFLLLTEIALYIKDDHTAMYILSCFEWNVLNCNIEESLALLEAQYKAEWCMSLLDKWKCKNISLQCDLGSTKSYILQEVDLFVSLYLSFGGTPQVVNYILNQELSHFNLCNNSLLNSSMKEKLCLVSNFCFASISISGVELMDKLLRYLVSNPLIYTRNFIFALYWKLKRTISPSDYNFIEPLRCHVVSCIDSEIEKVTNRKRDWSIKTGLLDCVCKLCEEVNAFLLSETASVMEMMVLWKHHKHLELRYSKLSIPVCLIVQPANQEEDGRGEKKGLMKVRINKHGKERYLEKLRFCWKQLQ